MTAISSTFLRRMKLRVYLLSALESYCFKAPLVESRHPETDAYSQTTVTCYRYDVDCSSDIMLFNTCNANLSMSADGLSPAESTFVTKSCSL